MLGRHIDTSLKGAAKGKVYILYIYTRVRARVLYCKLELRAKCNPCKAHCTWLKQ